MELWRRQWAERGSCLTWTDWDLIQAILLLCGVEFVAELDRSANCQSPFWISAPPSSTGPHWHILFRPDGSCLSWDRKSPENTFAIGRPCTLCTAPWGQL